MVKSKEKWRFAVKKTRPPLTTEQTTNLRKSIDKTLKIGVELEYNLKDQKSGCRGDNPECPCTSIYTVKGIECFRICALHGKCEMEKTQGCPAKQEYCVSFESSCSTCTKFSTGCSTCPKKFDPNKSPKFIREVIGKKLVPTKFVGALGANGVLDVVRDNSLSGDGGVEIVTVGRRTSFNSIYLMSKNIIDVVKEHDAFVDERTSIHFHFLTGYLSSKKYNERRPHYGIDRSFQSKLPQDKGGNTIIKDLETPIPEIVLANFHQLYRRFENAIIWITSSGSNYDTLTRWVKFRKSLLKHSAFRKHMQSIVKDMAGEGGTDSRYGAVNYVPIEFNSSKDISRLHFEIRVCDGSLSPASIAAFACMFYGLVMKAVDISRHGLLESGNSEYMKGARQISERLCNNDGGYGGPRTSDTKELNPHIPVLINQTLEMLTFIKPAIAGEYPAYEILRSLAERPLSTRRAAGESWKDIEKNLYMGNVQQQEMEEIENLIIKIIDITHLVDCETMQEWVTEVASDTEQEVEIIGLGVSSLMHSGSIVWDASLGSMIKK